MKFLFANRVRLLEIVRYLIAGGLNFLCTGAVFYALIELLRVSYHIALALAWVAGVLFNYAVHMVWVFRVATPVRPDRFIEKYFLVYAVVYLLNWAMLYVFVEFGGFRAMVAQLAAMPFIVAFNYVVIKFLVLRGESPS